MRYIKVRCAGLAAVCMAIFFGSIDSGLAQEGDGPQSTSTESLERVEKSELPAEGSAQDTLLLEEGDTSGRRRSPWSFALFNWANINMKYYRQGDGRLETYNYLSANYRLDWDSSISLRPQFFISGAGKDFFGDDAKSEIALGDIYLQYFRRKWFAIGDTVGVNAGARIIYPNSENAKQQKQIARIQARIILEWPLGRGWFITHRINPEYFIQSQRSYVNEYFNIKQNQIWNIEQALEISKFFGGNWGVHQGLLTEHRWYYDSPTNNVGSRNDTYLGMGSWVSYSAYKVTFKGGLNYKTKLGTEDRDKDWYNETDTSYSLMTYMRF